MISYVELKSAGYEIKAGSIDHSLAGSVFRCTMTPVSDDVLGTLHATVRAKGILRLAFPDRPLLIELVDVERIEPRSVRIAGRIRNSGARPDREPFSKPENEEDLLP